MFYKQLCATRPLPVKTFRTAATNDAAAPVCHDDGVSHVPPFVFLGRIWEIAKWDAVFGSVGESVEELFCLGGY